MQTLESLLKKGTTILKDNGLEEAGLDAWLLLEYKTGKNRAYYFAHGDEPVSDETAAEYLTLIDRRAGHIPVQQLTHQAFFMGYEFYVNENVLIPRQDTETLVEEGLKCLEDVGMLRTDPIMVDGKEVVPLQVLKELLPDPASLGPRTVGKTNIGCIFNGIKDGKKKSIYIYNVCDHQECYKEVGSQAISYTTGVPAMIGAALVVDKVWDKDGVFNIEEFDPDPFMDMLNQYGLPWVVDENPQTVA